MKIKMLEDDEVLINRVYHEFGEGQVTTVPDWAGRSLVDKGTAERVGEDDDTDDESDEQDAFATPGERETKVPDVNVETVTPPVVAEPTSEGSSWYQFRGQNGNLLAGNDGKTHKVLGTDERDTVLKAVNEA
jgi:hypothetical protein